MYLRSDVMSHNPFPLLYFLGPTSFLLDEPLVQRITENLEKA